MECSPFLYFSDFLLLNWAVIVVMEQQLIQVYSDTLRAFQGGEESLMANMEDHLRKKAAELNKLQSCFESQIKQIQSYESKQRLYKRIINSVLSSFLYFKNQLQGIKEVMMQVVGWRNDTLSSLRQLPVMFARIRENATEKEDSRIIKSRMEINETEFRRIETQYRQQIEKQNQNIRQLENTLLRHKSFSKTSTPTESLKRTPSQHMRSYNVQSQSTQHVSPLRDTKNSAVREKSRSPMKCVEKMMNKEEVIEKIRKYQQSKTSKENYSVVQRRSVQEHITKKTLTEVPHLPDIRLKVPFPAPILNGFDVLVVEGREVYKGMWKRGLFEGRGKFYNDNWVFDGQFRGGAVDGFGTLNFKGYTFIGKFENGQAQGEGTLYCKDMPVSGIWRDNILIKQY